jgi:hypothetical protein
MTHDIGILMSHLERLCNTHENTKAEAIQHIIAVVEAARAFAITMPSDSFYQETITELVQAVSMLR